MNLDKQDDEAEDELEEVRCTRTAFQNFGPLKEMENIVSMERKWEEMELDVLVRIFMSLNIIELTSGISRVCSSWRHACCDPIIWKTVDFGIIKSKFIKIPQPPYIWVAKSSDDYLMKVLKIAMGLSRGNANCLIFHIDLYLRDDQLMYIAERSPHLKRLVLPSWNLITKAGISKAVQKWPELECLTMPSIRDPPYILEIIGANSKNFTQLKIMGPFDVRMASSIATCLPNLKVLSLRCSLLCKEALVMVLDKLQHLEALNISHCLLIEKPANPLAKPILRREIDRSIVAKTSRLRNFFTCREDYCVLCERMIVDEGYLRWYKCEEGLWRGDEVSSLAY